VQLLAELLAEQLAALVLQLVRQGALVPVAAVPVLAVPVVRAVRCLLSLAHRGCPSLQVSLPIRARCRSVSRTASGGSPASLVSTNPEEQEAEAGTARRLPAAGSHREEADEAAHQVAQGVRHIVD